MLMNKEEFLHFERKWKAVSLVGGLIFIAALLDLLVRSPVGAEVIWCYVIGGAGFIICIYAAKTLRDRDRHDGAMGGLDLVGEELPGLGHLDD
jgi:hypothetical protein